MITLVLTIKIYTLLDNGTGKIIPITGTREKTEDVFQDEIFFFQKRV